MTYSLFYLWLKLKIAKEMLHDVKELILKFVILFLNQRRCKTGLCSYFIYLGML